MTQDTKETAEVSRPGLHVWLRSVVEEGKSPGVEWEDEEEGSFRIPWRNQKSRYWEESDSRIFMEYAKHTGKYKGGAEMDFPRWKQNLKSAINKNRFIERLRGCDRLSGPKPYRVYQFLRDDISDGRHERPNLSPSHKSSSATNSLSVDLICKRQTTTPPGYGRSDAVLSPGLSCWSPPANIRSDACDQLSSGNIPELDGLLSDEAGNSPRAQPRGLLRGILEDEANNLTREKRIPIPELAAPAISSYEFFNHAADVDMLSDNESELQSQLPTTEPVNNLNLTSTYAVRFTPNDLQTDIKPELPMQPRAAVKSTPVTVRQAPTLNQDQLTTSVTYSNLPFHNPGHYEAGGHSLPVRRGFAAESSLTAVQHHCSTMSRTDYSGAFSYQPQVSAQLDRDYMVMQSSQKTDNHTSFIPGPEQMSSHNWDSGTESMSVSSAPPTILDLSCVNNSVGAVKSSSQSQTHLPAKLGQETRDVGAVGGTDQPLMQLQLLYGTPHYVAHSVTLTSSQPNCRLYHGEVKTSVIQKELQGTTDALQIELPEVDEQRVEKQNIEYIKDILQNFEAGIHLSFRDGDIYAERRCRPRVFVSNGVSTSKVLTRSSRKRKVETKIFDYKSFEEALEKHKQDIEQPVPRDHVLLTIGREILSNDDSPTRHLPIYMVIRHKQAADERYRILGVSAISANPMYSDPDSFDRISQLFMEIDLKNRWMN